MKKKNKGRRKTTSCGTVTWRVTNGRIELLLIKQFEHNDSWGIPKGHIDEGESLEACAIRETREETGVHVALGERLADMYIENNHEDKTVVSWLARPTGSEEPLHDDPDSEVVDARWFGVDELPRVHLYQRVLIASAVEKLWEVVKDVEKRKPVSQPEELRRLVEK